MKQRPRIYYTESQKALMWERWRQGESLQQIAQLFDRGHSSIQGVLAATGGIRPTPRCRSRLALTLAEREEISRGLVARCSIRSIATRLLETRTFDHQPRNQPKWRPGTLSG
jgi:IS30 family transposase